uniref:Uncharacterized protein n=1 Tax=Nelumbo nucifera TaxID=4432 RepID=A0A822YEF6_NELNU|nr:TPA_asm: hypothetical protein HUJ06_011405 [Nelumbo nucifera]
MIRQVNERQICGSSYLGLIRRPLSRSTRLVEPTEEARIQVTGRRKKIHRLTVAELTTNKGRYHLEMNSSEKKGGEEENKERLNERWNGLRRAQIGPCNWPQQKARRC